MQAATLIGPIAAATIVNVLVFALVWKGSQEEGRTGRPPSWLYALTIAYGVVVLGALYARFNNRTPSGLDFFVVALIAEMFGGGIVYALTHGFIYSRGKPFRERAFPMFAGTFLALVAFATVFTSR